MNSALAQLVILAVAMAAGGYVRTVTSPLQEAMRVSLSLTDNHMALVQGAVIGIPIALAAIPLGVLIDRQSRVRLLGALIVISVLANVATAFASSFPALLVARSVAGVAGLGTVPVVFALIPDIFPAAQRGRVMTVVVIGQVAGNSAAFAVGGALLAMTGADPEGWRWAVLWSNAPLVLAMLLLIALREPARTGVATSRPSAAEVWRVLRGHSAAIGPLVIGILLAETAIGALLVWSAPMLSRRFSLAPGEVGALMAVGVLVSGIVGPIVGGLLADIAQRTGGPRRTSAWLSALALASAPMSAFAWAPDAVWVAILLTGAMTTALAIAVMGETLFTIVIPGEVRGLSLSILVAANILFALAVAPFAVSLLSGALGGLASIGTALSALCVATSLVATIAFALGRHTLACR